ncbi:MAG: VacB/RNase II family 3'-5' exoribonuclease [Phycisphaerae bacterium]|jgi:ribonuclease R
MPTPTRTSTAATWRRAILQYIADHPDRPLKTRALARELNIPTPDYNDFHSLVRDLVRDGTLRLAGGRALALPADSGTIVGTIHLHPRGFAFLSVPGQADLYIRRGHTGGALDGDTVSASVVRQRRGRQTVTRAEVRRIITRAPIRWVGVLQRAGRRYVVQPQGRTPTPLVHIEDPTAKSARPGDLVVVEPLERTLGTTNVRGVILERLGPPDEAQTKILGIIRRFGLMEDFPAPVRRAAQRAVAAFDPEAPAGREDLRQALTVTVDPDDARDFDDAFSIRTLDDGRVELGVHIADVAHFVRTGGPLDAEALRRGNSVYFPGRVVPMLPEVLSNGVCSLQPGEPRLTKSAFITYDAQARPVATRLANTVIRSACRLTYDEVTAILEGKQSTPARITKLLCEAEALARRIQQRRLRQGMIVLSMPEVEIRLGNDGEVADAYPADRSFSHTIIEMFMVEANEAVSRYLKDAGLAHLRRIHPPPEPLPGKSFRQLAGVLGDDLPATIDRTAILRLLDRVRGKPEEPAVHTLLLQSMAQAYYGPADEGHFALASEDYCHFTSPIRRYPDLVNHRLLDHALRAGRPRGGRRRAPVPFTELEEIGRQTSSTERQAQQAEREATAALLLGFMADKVGQTFEGVVTAVVSAGAIVQIQPHLAEGLVPVSEFGDDRWELDEGRAAFIGRRTRRAIMVGQSVRVMVAEVDETRQQMLLVPARASAMGRDVRASRKSRRGRGRTVSGRKKRT